MHSTPRDISSLIRMIHLPGFFRSSLDCNRCFAFSSSCLRAGDNPLPARLMKNWIIRVPEAIPFGLTFLLAMARAIVAGSLVKMREGGYVETVFTSLTQRLFAG